MASVTMKIFRGDAHGGELKPYTVETDPGMVVLDVVHRVQATQEPDLLLQELHLGLELVDLLLVPLHLLFVTGHLRHLPGALSCQYMGGYPFGP